MNFAVGVWHHVLGTIAKDPYSNSHSCHDSDRGETRGAQLRQDNILRLYYKTYYEREKEEVAPRACDKYHFHAKPSTRHHVTDDPNLHRDNSPLLKADPRSLEESACAGTGDGSVPLLPYL
jgi:hypothetical protein